MGLTHRQAEVLTFIADFIREHGGVSPSYREIAAWMGATTKSVASRYVAILVERGYLSRGPKHRARTLEVLRMPGTTAAAPDDPAPAPPDGNIRRYQALDDLLHRHYAMALGRDADTIASKALHWIAITTMQAPEEIPGMGLRHIATALMNAAQEQVRRSVGIR